MIKQELINIFKILDTKLTSMVYIEIDEKCDQFVKLIEEYKEFQEAIMNISQLRYCISQAQFMIQKQSNSLPIDMPQELGYLSLVEMDSEEFQVQGNIQEKNAPTFSLNDIIHNYNNKYDKFLIEIEEGQYELMECTYNQFKQLRVQLFQLIHKLRWQILNRIQYLDNGQNNNGFPLKFETYEQLYSLIASLIKKNTTTIEKLMNISYDKESLHSLHMIIRFLKIQRNIPWNHYLIVMNTFALQLQNETLYSKFLDQLFFSQLYFNIKSKTVDQEVNKEKFNTFLMMYRDLYDPKKHDLDHLIENDQQQQRSFQLFKHNQKEHSDLISVLNEAIIPHLQQNWQAIKQDITDLLLKVGQSSRFKQGIKSFKSCFQIQGHVNIKPFWLTNIHFYYICEQDILGFTIMNGDIIVNLKNIAEAYRKDKNIDISQIFKAQVLFLLIHEYAHIVMRRSLNDWQFQTTQLGDRQAVEYMYPKESGEIFEIILFGNKFYEKSESQGGQSSSNEADSNKFQKMKGDQKLINNLHFLKEILEDNYWSLPIKRKYPISENILTTVACLNRIYQHDQIMFRQMFEQSALQNGPNFASYAEFLQFIWSIDISIAEYKIKETYNYIKWENKQLISYYMITIALQLDQRTDVTN